MGGVTEAPLKEGEEDKVSKTEICRGIPGAKLINTGHLSQFNVIVIVKRTYSLKV